MNPWLMIIITALLIVGSLVLFAGLLGALIMRIARRHAEKTVAQYVKKMVAMTPGINCGKCGYDSCHAYAEALIRDEAAPDLCREGHEGLEEELAACVMDFRRLAAPPEDDGGKKPGCKADEEYSDF